MTIAEVSTPTLLTFLARHVDWLMHRPEAEQVYDELLAALLQVRQVVDTAPATAYAGPCDVCGRDMYANPDAAEVTCRLCALTYPMASRRQWLLKAAEDRLERAALIARVLSAFGYQVTRHRIGTWRDRGKIEARDKDSIGRPLYRVGDVWDLLEAEDDTPAAG